MYKYDTHDTQIVKERVAQFRGQTERFFSKQLTDEEFLVLRLQNGLYIQRMAPMLRIAIPYGMIASEQLRTLSHLCQKYDKGYLHFTTRQNIQFHWPALEDVPDILRELSEVEMHSIQTSGNCIRNTTTDPYAGVIKNEVTDPRPYCEIIRQWSTLHPEFAYLPRKFKIAVNGSPDDDRAAIRFHDIGIELIRNENNELGYKIFVGGGLGRTPAVGALVNDFLPELDLLTYLEAIVRVYNRYGRRDNKFKARIKILVKALGVNKFRTLLEKEWKNIRNTESQLTHEEISRVQSLFSEPPYSDIDNNPDSLINNQNLNKAFSNWIKRNTRPHKKQGYSIVTLTLKKTGVPTGDVTSEQLTAIADLADQYSFGEARVTHDQNVVLGDVAKTELFKLWNTARLNGFATPNLDMLTDIICCPGGDYCSLANAKSIPVAEQIQLRFDDMDYLYDLGEIELNISGCMNACGHHHIGNIGILGVDKRGAEFYQVSLGGCSGKKASIGKILGPSFARSDMADVIEKIIHVYVENRINEEPFNDTYNRIGITPFKERVYGSNNS